MFIKAINATVILIVMITTPSQATNKSPNGKDGVKYETRPSDEENSQVLHNFSTSGTANARIESGQVGIKYFSATNRKSDIFEDGPDDRSTIKAPPNGDEEDSIRRRKIESRTKKARRKFFKIAKNVRKQARFLHRFTRISFSKGKRVKRNTATGLYARNSWKIRRVRQTNWIQKKKSMTWRSASIPVRPEEVTPGPDAREVEPLPPVSFGQFNYDYNLKPDPVCVHREKPEKNVTVASTVAVTTTPPPPTDPYIPLTGRHKESILREHNRYRASTDPQAADMRLISWDDELQYASETFTNSCTYRDIVEPKVFNADGSQVFHPIKLQRHTYLGTEIGRTWYAWPDEHLIPEGFAKDMVAAWDAEKDYYDRLTKECVGICEHFLQLIWAETFKLGCGAARCANATINGADWPDTILIVCSYTPRGGLSNFMATNHDFQFFDPKLFVPPYTAGVPCSLCVLNPADPDQNLDEMRSTTDGCWNGLCTNELREKVVPFTPNRTTTTYAWTRKKTTPTPPTTAEDVNYTTNATEIQEQEDIVWVGDGQYGIHYAGSMCILPASVILYFLS